MKPSIGLAPHWPTRQIAPRPRCVGTKRGVNYGLVYDETGRVIGRVFRHSRVAAGMKGERASFYTANVIAGGMEAGGSLGTRHPNRASAVRAIRAFAAEFPPERMDLLIANESHSRFTNAPEWLTRVALNRATYWFKAERWEVCALPYRTIKHAPHLAA